MSSEKNEKNKTAPLDAVSRVPAPEPAPKGEPDKEPLSLNDDRRVKVLSPGAMVTKRFFRNRIAVVGLAVLIFMFLFSFLGGLISPYKQDQSFYTTETQKKVYAGAVKNKEFRFASADGQNFRAVLQAQMKLALKQNKTTFAYNGRSRCTRIYEVRNQTRCQLYRGASGRGLLRGFGQRRRRGRYCVL